MTNHYPNEQDMKKTHPVRDPSSSRREKQVWLHVKSQQYYEIIGYGLLESTLEPIVIYRRRGTDAPLWVRPVAEFFDGRFTQQP